MSLRDFAERFSDDTSYDEMQAPLSQRRAVGLARALQAGALYATAQSPSWDLDELKPVLAAHAAVVAGRQAAAVALREVLRELYPAALRAYLDPAEFIPLKILEAFPEPGCWPARRPTAEPGVGRRRRADRERRHRHHHRRERHHRAARRGRGVAAAGTPTGCSLRSSPRPSGRPSPPCVPATPPSAALVGSLVERLNALASGDAAPESCIPAAAPVSPAVPRRANAAPGRRGAAEPHRAASQRGQRRRGRSSASPAASAPPPPTASRRRGPSRASRPGTARADYSAYSTARPYGGRDGSPLRRRRRPPAQPTATARPARRRLDVRTARATARRTAATQRLAVRPRQRLAVRRRAPARRSGTSQRLRLGAAVRIARRPTARTRCRSAWTR